MTNEQIQTDVNAAIYFLDEACSALGGIEECIPAIQAMEAVLKMLEDRYGVLINDTQSN